MIAPHPDTPALRATAGVAFEALTAADAATTRPALFRGGLRGQNTPLLHHGRQPLVVGLETTRLLRQQGVTRLHSPGCTPASGVVLRDRLSETTCSHHFF